MAAGGDPGAVSIPRDAANLPSEPGARKRAHSRERQGYPVKVELFIYDFLHQTSRFAVISNTLRGARGFAAWHGTTELPDIKSLEEARSANRPQR